MRENPADDQAVFWLVRESYRLGLLKESLRWSAQAPREGAEDETV